MPWYMRASCGAVVGQCAPKHSDTMGFDVLQKRYPAVSIVSERDDSRSGKPLDGAATAP